MVTEKREEKGLSQNQLSKLSGVPQSVISDIESGKTKDPRINTLILIANALETTVGELINSKKAV